jgi:uncharacterized protein (DUF1684 family)
MNQAEEEAYRQQIVQWRKDREAALRAPDGWLSLTGLFMLEEGGVYRLGSNEANQIQLPPSAPAKLGTLSFNGGKATLQVSVNGTGNPLVAVNGEAVTSVEMVDNHHGQRPTIVTTGSVSFNLHKFGDEVALRVRDSASPAIQEFEGCKWYEIKPEYRVAAKVVRRERPESITVTTSVKTAAQYASVGALEFELLGQPLTLLASLAGKPSELFIILRDATAGRSSYGAGRYLYAEIDGDGNAILDFNKAYSPPCAFTPYATCSLPPVQNILRVAIEAGELY